MGGRIGPCWEATRAPTQWPRPIQGMLRHPPFHLLIAQVPTIGRGTQAKNPGGAGAKPPQAALAANFQLKHGRPLIMHRLLSLISEHLHVPVTSRNVP